MNAPPPEQTDQIPPADIDLDISVENVSIAEIEEAIKILGNNKASGVDMIWSEMLNADSLETL